MALQSSQGRRHCLLIIESAKAGIGVGAALGSILSFALLASLLWLRMKGSAHIRQANLMHAQEHDCLGEYRNPELPGDNDSVAARKNYDDSTPIYGLSSPEEEKGSFELDGSQRGTNAAAIVEVYLSTPRRGKEAAKVEKLEQIHSYEQTAESISIERQYLARRLNADSWHNVVDLGSQHP